jgi:hypothetical protein
MLPPVVPVSAVCDELGISRKTFRRYEAGGRIPPGAVTEYRGVKYVLADRLTEVMDRIAQVRAKNWSATC